MTADPDAEREQILDQQLYIGGANRSFGDVTLDGRPRPGRRAAGDDRLGADGAGGSGRTAWRELVIEMERSGCSIVGELDTPTLTALAPKLWVVMPGL